MLPDWIQEIVLWASLVFSGYCICHFQLEKKFRKELELKTEKLLRKIDQLKREKAKSGGVE